jgi:hypothetical protein
LEKKWKKRGKVGKNTKKKKNTMNYCCNP